MRRTGRRGGQVVCNARLVPPTHLQRSSTAARHAYPHKPNSAVRALKARFTRYETTANTLPLRGVIEVPPAEHHRHLSEPELGAFWRAVERQGAHFVTIASTKLLMYSMCRKSEVLRARWREFDLEKGQWDLPAERMKMKAAAPRLPVAPGNRIVDLLKALGSEPQGVSGFLCVRRFGELAVG